MGSRDERIGSRIGKCEIREKLGEVEGGVDYLAIHRSIEGFVIVRIIDRSWLGADARSWFKRAQKVVSLKHPNVVRLFGVGEEDGSPFLVLQHIPGHRLDVVLRERGSLDLKEARGITAKMAGALAAAHRKGLTHGTVTPAHMWIRSDGTPKLAGLGLALSPSDVRSDIRSLGESFRRMLLGSRPVGRELPEEAEPLIAKMEDTDDRSGFRGMEEVILELQNIQAGRSSGRWVKPDGDVIEPPDDVDTMLEFDVPPELK